MTESFHVGLSPDVRGPGGRPSLDFSLGLLEQASGVEWSFVPGDGLVLSPDQVRDFDAILLFAPRVTRATLEGVERLAVVARMGVGYEDLDLAALTEKGVLVTNAPDGVRRPMACSAILLVLASAQRLLIKDRIAREGAWDERWNNVGMGLTGRTLGLIGAGNIGQEIFRLARPFGMKHVAYDPYVTKETASAIGFELVALDVLLAESDFVCIACPLSEETRHLIDADRLSKMKAAAYLINIARGAIVDESALYEVLSERRILGAALDVFEQEPLTADNPLLRLDNVIVAPHSIGHTDELFRLCGKSACESVLAVASGQVPKYVVNPSVLDDPRVAARLAV